MYYISKSTLYKNIKTKICRLNFILTSVFLKAREMGYTKRKWGTPSGNGVHQVEMGYTKWKWGTPSGKEVHMEWV